MTRSSTFAAGTSFVSHRRRCVRWKADPTVSRCSRSARTGRKAATASSPATGGSPELLGRRGPLHQLVVRLAEPEAPVEIVRVFGVQQPLAVGERTTLDHLAHDLRAEASPAGAGKHVHVGE